MGCNQFFAGEGKVKPLTSRWPKWLLVNKLDLIRHSRTERFSKTAGGKLSIRGVGVASQKGNHCAASP